MLAHLTCHRFGNSWREGAGTFKTMKCRRYIRELGRKCGKPAVRASVRKRPIGTFCEECHLIVMRDTVGVRQLLGSKYDYLGPVAHSQAKQTIQEECEKLLRACPKRMEY